MVTEIFKNIDRSHLAAALVVLLGSLFVYVKTMAPTLSFWDCGEFIAVSAILGIPHPPGAPLYVMIGHLFSIIPSFEDISARVNLLSASSSSFTALFCYLCGVRILRPWFGSELTWLNRLLLYGGSASGALLAAFGITNWNNSVEAEVYGLSMLIFMAIVWLTLIYLEQPNNSRSSRILLLVAYLGFLGISVHMTTFLAVPILALAFILKKDSPVHIWFLLAGFVLFELYLIFALSSRPEEVPYYVPIAIVFITYMFFIFSFEKIGALYLTVAAGFTLSIAPLYSSIYNAATATSAGVTAAGSNSAGMLNNIGLISFIALILYALFSLVKFFRLKKLNQTSVQHLHIAIFVLTAAIMTVILSIDQLKGYKAFLVISVFLAAIVMLFMFRHINWSYLIAFGGALTVVLGVMPFFYGVLAAAAAITIAGLFFRLGGWKTSLLILLMAVLGFSSHLFIPIRSAHQPAINENNPSQSLQGTINYLERKQYGSQSMIERMFVRRGEWINQFGNFQRMGFWRFFSQQFGVSGSAFVFPLLIGVFGLWEIVRRGPPKGVLVLLLVILSSIGLVLYMNFADGTRQHPVSGSDYLEVRDRDYFFTPAFILFGLCIGLGVAAVIQYVNETLSTVHPVLKKTVIVIASILLLMPAMALSENFHYADRSDNYVPFDYGWDLLTSADENAIFFTNGDNDTFPLWCLQQAYGIRKDVRVVNLSLANTNWYIKQLSSNLGLKFTLSDAEIDKLRPFRTENGTVTRIHHQVADRIIFDNYGQIPINFSVTVGGDNRRYRGQSVDSLMALMGFSWRLYGKPRHFGVDAEEGYDFFMNPAKFKCRGANDPKVYLDDSSERLARNLANGFTVLADSLRKAKDFDRAEKLLLRCRELIPQASDPIQLLARIYSEKKEIEPLRTLIDTCQFDNKAVLLFFLGQAYKSLADDVQAEAAFNASLQIDPSYRPAFDELMRMYMSADRIGSVGGTIKRWLQFNPHDGKIRELYQEMEKALGSDSIGKTIQ